MIALIIWAIVYSFSEPAISDGYSTYAVIKEFKSKPGSGRNSVFEYNVDGKTYDFWGYYNNTLIIGDKFIIECDDKKPEKSKIYIDKPLFLGNEKTIKTTGKITRVKNYSKKAVYFEYVANGGLYTRIQCLPDNYKKLYSDITEGGEYLVEYWSKNPQRAIIYLDKSD